MRPRTLTDVELQQVIKQRQSNASWLKIQKETLIPRRAAKRAYEIWERNQSLEELKAARKDVAAEEFRQHLDDLARFAQSLVAHIRAPSWPTETADAATHLRRFWESDITRALAPHSSVSNPGRAERERRQAIRRNRMLYDALRSHTREEVRWELMDKWEHHWDNCVKAIAELRTQAHEVVGNFVKQEQGLADRIKSCTDKGDAVERMAESVLRAAWSVGTTGGPEEAAIFDVMSSGKGSVVISAEPTRGPGLTFIDDAVAHTVARVCTLATQNLRVGDILARVADEVRTIEDIADKLDEMLHPLRLRPIILRTRCDLCPV